MIFVEIILLAYFLYVVSYSLFFGIGGLFYKPSSETKEPSDKKYLILVPGYKEDGVIISTAKQNLDLNYPKENYTLNIIADSFEASTLAELKKMPLEITEVSFDNSTKVKAMKRALLQLEESAYDYIVILDADNVMEEDYLLKVDSLMQAKNLKALQTQRAPKNNNNELAVLDGISEAINNHIYRMGSAATGFSSALNGSGMIFDYKIYRNIITQMDSIGGFDRELEYKLIEQGIKVSYQREALVFDEKVDNNKTFENQRKRWISSQYVYLMKYLGRGTSALLKGNLVYFNSTVWRNIQLPRLINLGLLTVFTLIAVLTRNIFENQYLIWLSLWYLNTIAIAISIPKSFYNKKLLKSIVMLPELFIKMFKLMFKLKGANKKFIHTPHKTAH